MEQPPPPLYVVLDPAPPPGATLAWAARAISPTARITHVAPLAGGSSGSMHALSIDDGRNSAAVQTVLRRYTIPHIIEEEPGLPDHEAAVLRLFADTAVPAPRFLALDAHAEHTDVPALLMTRLAGMIDLAPRDLGLHVERLAAAIAPVHAVAPDAPIPPFARYYGHADDVAPAWSSNAGAWRAIIAHAHRPPPPSTSTLIHRDYHPGNVLWLDGNISGIVDWASASVGPPGVDAGHCRWNLAALHGPDAAGAFLDAWLRVGQHKAHDPYYDIVTLLDSGITKKLEPGTLEAWYAAGRTDLTLALVQQRLDAYAVVLAGLLRSA